MSAHRMLTVVSAGLALLAATAAGYAAETRALERSGRAYPVKPIRLIVPFPPGGSADPLARAFGAWFSDKFGVPVVADNRPGAGTAIAHTLGARAAPDVATSRGGACRGSAKPASQPLAIVLRVSPPRRPARAATGSATRCTRPRARSRARRS